MIFLLYLFLTSLSLSLILSIILVTYIRTNNDIESLPDIDIDDLDTIDKIKSLGFFNLFVLVVFISLVLPFILLHILYKKILNFKGQNG